MISSIENIQNNQLELLSEIDTLQIDTVELGKNSVKLTRGPRGRFVVGNRESVGNKGGRPKDITLKEIMEDENKIYELIQNGDDRSFKALTKFFDGKLK